MRHINHYVYIGPKSPTRGPAVGRDVHAAVHVARHERRHWKEVQKGPYLCVVVVVSTIRGMETVVKVVFVTHINSGRNVFTERIPYVW